LDTRHHRFKPKVNFPAEWRITKERRTELIKYRQAAALIDQRRELAGQLVDGIQQIEADLAKQVPVKESLPTMMMASRGSKGQQKKVTIRR
jgi:small subunit ribosomal protein S35